MTDDNTVRVLFVCLGNICRSPTAHGLLRARLANAGLTTQIKVDSAGTGDWHVGQPPDGRAQAAAAERGVDISDLRARQVRAEDLTTFDWIIAMDRQNEANLQALAQRWHPARRDHIVLLTTFCRQAPAVDDVPDPYADGPDGFEHVLNLIEEGVAGLIKHLSKPR